MGVSILGAITPTVRVPRVPAPDETAVDRGRCSPPARGRGGRDRGLGRGRGDPAGQPRVHRRRDRRPCSSGSGPPTCSTATAAGASPAGSRRRPASRAIVVTSGTEGTPKGVELTTRRHGRDGPRLLRRPRRRRRPTAGSRACRCTTSRASASWPALVRHRRAVHRARRLRPRRGRAITARARERRSCRSCRRRCGACSTPARRCTSSARASPAARRARPRCARAPRRRASPSSTRTASRETWGGFALDGVPIAGAEVAARAPTARSSCAGAMVMRGYRLDPRTAPRTALDADGWLHTGDIGAVDDAGRAPRRRPAEGSRHHRRRQREPDRGRGVLAHHPDVARRRAWSASPTTSGASSSSRSSCRAPRPRRRRSTTLRAFARERLSAPKLPRQVVGVDAIPRTASGKVLRRLLPAP